MAELMTKFVFVDGGAKVEFQKVSVNDSVDNDFALYVGSYRDNMQAEDFMYFSRDAMRALAYAILAATEEH